MTTGILDTSVLIAAESGRPLDQAALPDNLLVTVITLAELEAGVLVAGSTDERSARLRTVQWLADVEPLPVTIEAAHEWARLRSRLAEDHRKVNVNDLWIAAIALANRLPVITQDADFDVLIPNGGPHVIRV